MATHTLAREPEIRNVITSLRGKREGRAEGRREGEEGGDKGERTGGEETREGTRERTREGTREKRTLCEDKLEEVKNSLYCFCTMCVLNKNLQDYSN